MTRPFNVARALAAEEVDSFELAVERVTQFPDAELHQTIVATNIGVSSYRLAAGLYHAELDRR